MRKHKYVIWGKGAVAEKRRERKGPFLSPVSSRFVFAFALSQLGVREYLWRALANRPSRSRNRLLISERLSKIPKFSKSEPCSLEPLVNDHLLQATATKFWSGQFNNFHLFLATTTTLFAFLLSFLT